MTKIKLTEFNEFLKTLCVLTFVAVGVALCVTLGHVNRTLDSVDQTTAAVRTTLNATNAMIAQGTATLGAVNQAVGQINDVTAIAKVQEQKELAVFDGLNSRIQSTADHFDDLITSTNQRTNTLLDSANKTVADVQPSLDSLRTLLDKAQVNLATLNTTEQSLNTLVSNKDIPASIKDVHSILDSGKQIAADGQHAVHSYVYPKPIVSIVNWTLKGVQTAGSWLHF